jgi:DNA-binding winged helix-turn-helix (wHTH) protein
VAPAVIVNFGECQLNLDGRELQVHGKLVHVTPKAFDLLRLLVESRGRALAKDEIIERVWQGTFVTEDSLPRLVNEIRSAIGDSARNPVWLRTIHGYGYGFATPGADAMAESQPSQFALRCGARQFLLSHGSHIVGRNAQATIPMYSSTVSRRHARIVVTDSGVFVEDLGSKNGTFIGGQRIEGRHELHDGDEIGVGEFTLAVLSLADPATETMGS